MKKYRYIISYLIITFLFTGFNATNAQYNGVYIGGPMWYGGESTYNKLRSSGFNEIILWAIHIDPGNGDIYLNLPAPWNRVTLFKDGAWVSTTDNEAFLVNLRSFKEGTTSIKRITWSIGTSFDNDFQSIETLIDNQGTGINSILYRNFRALKNKMPFIDALDYDDEMNYDVASTTQFSIMAADLGFKITFSPYTRSSFWQSIYNNTERERPGTIDCIHLQCYAGGAGNNPGTWNQYFGELKVTPGLQGPNSSASTVASRMRNWENRYSIAGGFMWLWDDIEAGTSPNSAANYAAAIQPVVDASGTIVNLALNKSTTQSSTGFGGVSGRAVDNNTNGVYRVEKSVTHTNRQTHAWWEVDLGSISDITNINVWNRTDCCSNRLSNFHVFVSDTPFSSTNLNTTINQSGVGNYYTSGQGGTPTTININRSGRYIRVQLAGTNFLSLAEVQVHGARKNFLTTSTSNQTETQIKKSLLSNKFKTYPNPFKKEVNIDYQLEKESKIEVSVYDMSGRRVTQITNQSQKPGEHTIKWKGINSNGARVSNGMYIIKIITPDKTQYQNVLFDN